MKIFYFLLIIAGGFTVLRYHKWIVDSTMRFPSVEKFLGPGGTYTFWKLIGVLVIFFSFWYLMN